MDCDAGGPPSFPRLDHASKAFTRQLVLTFEKVAAASESLSFSAYPQIMFLPRAAALATASLEGTVGVDADVGRGEGSGDGIGKELGVDAGGVGVSIVLRFVMPRHIVFASLEVRVDGAPCCG